MRRSVHHSAGVALSSARHLRGAHNNLHHLIVRHYFELRHSDFVIVSSFASTRPAVAP
jgi:hypothetical protein